jgi:small subunit ribosomal protein S5
MIKMAGKQKQNKEEKAEIKDEILEEVEEPISTEEVDAVDYVPKEEEIGSMTSVEIKAPKKEELMGAWTPRTGMGKQVKNGSISSIDYILDNGHKILESEIIDFLLPGLDTDLLLVGQSKGKFGGGQRRVFRQTQKKTREGNKPNFATVAIIGDRNGHIGIGYGKSRETVPAREKAIRKAKLNMFKIRRGSGSWESAATEPNSIPFKVVGKCGSAELTLMPAPKGTGLCVEKECAKILALAGIKDIWSKARGQTKTKINLIKACEEALKQLSKIKVMHSQKAKLAIFDGPAGERDE